MCLHIKNQQTISLWWKYIDHEFLQKYQYSFGISRAVKVYFYNHVCCEIILPRGFCNFYATTKYFPQILGEREICFERTKNKLDVGYRTQSFFVVFTNKSY